MKLNKLLAGLGAAVLTAALAVTASAADPLVVWDFSQADNTAFYNADGTVAFDVNNGTATYDAENACLNLDVEGGDPFFILPNQGTFPAENSFVRVKYNLTGISDWSTSIYFTTDTVQWSETGHWKGFYDGDDGEWCEQTFYMTECGAWAGTITDMRLDIFDSASAGQNAKVAYVAVFGNEADANAFDFAAWQAAGRPVTLEAAPAAASDRVSAVAVGGAGIFTYDESDGEYWSPALTMLDKSGVVMALEDGSIVGYSDVSTYTDPANVKTMATLTPGWYEVVLCNLGTNPEWFPADVNGKVALCVRGDSTFTVKSENSMNAGAVACLIGNNCRAVELVDETGVMTGEYENVSMSVDYYTIPMCALSSDVTARLVATTADISIADAVVAVENVFFGDLELSVSHKKSAYIFLGTLEEYEANKTRTDANTVTAGGGVAVSAPAASTEAPAAEVAAAQAEGELQNLCLGATITEISGLETEGANTGEMAIDGDLATRWSSNTSDDAHIIIDIGQPLP
ncbi:MAG: hypothetical protein J6C42_13645, partial [Clostridia bacterium]|nr:hypothetical protein [Clostridia bacterium]